MENTSKVTIHTEGTPNPNALKFVLDRDIIQSGTLNFASKEFTKDTYYKELVQKIQ